MVQFIIIGVLLVAALAYLWRMVYRSFQGRTHCETGCGKCGEIEKSLEGLPLKK
jgi:hypothetical protein